MALVGAVVCAFATELINWFLIYRHEDFKDLTREIVDSTNKLSVQKEKFVYNAGVTSANQQKAQQKKIAMAEADLRSKH